MPARSRKHDLTRIKPSTRIEKLFHILSIILIIILPVLLLACFRVVKQYKRAVILRFGRVRKDSPAGPGIIFVIPFTDQVTLIDIRTQSFSLPQQQVITNDSVSITVNAVIYFHIVSPVHCLLNIQFYRISIELVAVSVLRTVIGQRTLTEAMQSRESISIETKEEIQKVANDWGIHIERIEIKNVMLPVELQTAMAAEAEGVRNARAKIIGAEGEIKAAINLAEASKSMTADVMLLRYFQTLNTIASNKKTTILFPIPINLPQHAT